MIELGREWHAMPHRRDLLVFLNGGIIQTMMGDDREYPFFDELRADWSGKLDAQGRPESLRLLVERFNPANYRFEVRDGKRVPVSFQWPEAIERRNAEDLRRISAESTVMNLPQQCRDRLNAAQPLAQEQVIRLWQYLQSIEGNSPPLVVDGEPLIHIEDALCGGIAVLVILHHDWLAADPERMAWCRRKLEAVFQQPPTTFRFDAETARGECRWDAFAAEVGISLLARNREDALARLLAATGVLAFHYSTTARTLFQACQCREQLGEDFDRMLSLAIRWAGLRTPYTLAARPQFDTPREIWHERKRALIQDFVDRRLPVELPDIKATNAAAAAEIEAIHVQQFPESARARGAGRRSRRRARRSRETLYPESLRLDSHVISSAFAWLDVRSARSDERRQWLGFIRNFFGLVLGSIPQVDDPRQQEIEGLPDHFDNWVFGLVAGAIPSLTAAEDPRSLWQPILDLGSPAHQWVERFFWDWFTDGLRAAQSPEDFARLWADMIGHALASQAWDPSVNRTHDLDGMVFELLGFDTRMNKLGHNPAFGPALAGMENVFARAAQRWFGMPKVVTGFLNFVIQPAAAALLLPGIRWVAAAVPSFDSYDWKYGLEDNLIAFLHACWEREHHRISSDPSLQGAFLSLLACVVSRGGHAAIALRDRVVNSAIG
jgi:hypothetical protein